MLQKLLAIVRLSRPFFLAGGVVVYALGALIARYEGYPLDWRRYFIGQIVITGLQWMTHALNEYWDVEADRLNRTRTWFSGGSGVLPAGQLSRETALAVGFSGLALASAAAAMLGLQNALAPAGWAILGLGFLGAFFYSSPPVRLVNTGYGEITTSVLVGGLIPAFSHVIQAGAPSALVLYSTAPLVLLAYAMILTFELPDQLSDEAAGKRTVIVRLGTRNSARLHNAVIILALVLTGLVRTLGLPARVALSLVFTAPLALWQVISVRRLQQGDPIPFTRLTVGSVALFGLTAYFLAFNYWVIS